MPELPVPEVLDILWPAKFGDQVVTINKADFDPARHRLPDDAAPTLDTEAAAPTRRRKDRGAA